MHEFIGMFSHYYIKNFMFMGTEAWSLVLFICLAVELTSDNLIIVQACISNALLLNCFRWVLWIVCIQLRFTGSQKDSPA